MKSELYALHGLQGVAQNAHEQHSARKQIVVQYLQNSLQNATGRTSVRLNYVNFTEKIVLGHGVDLVGWPQGVGLNAGGLTRANLQRVFDGVTADPPTIYFKKLTPDEHAEKKEAWDLAQHAKSTTQAPQPSSPSLTNVQSLPTPDSQAQTIPHLVELVPTPPVTPSPSPACPTHPSSYGATATLEAPVQSTAPQAVARDASSPLAIELPELSSVADDNTSGTTQAGLKRPLDVNLVDTDVTTGATKEPVSKKQRRTGRNTGSSVARGKSPNVPAESQLPIAEYSPVESTNPTTRSGRKIKKTQRANFVENETYS
ncbi:hypothetical protein FRC03_008193 [Tulasnella sp. 419]|nr:hypothetical protein FRC03_008193 [Tulasnella sp. 419]